ncbi:MAG: hypothetical protein ABJH52_07525 [Henriciella sp.]
MLLRRITKHVKEQNWLAVGIDFIIVVIGVFIGIQVSNWNDVRVEKQTERQLVDRVQQEFSLLESQLVVLVRRLNGIKSGTGCLIGEIRKEEPMLPHEEMSECIWGASALSVLPDAPAVVTEMVSSGRLSQLSNKELRKQIILYRDNHQRYERYMPQALASMYPPNSQFFDAVHWNTDTETWTFQTASDAVLSYDFQKLQQAEGELQIKQLVQHDVSDFGMRQLELSREILALIGASETKRENEVETGITQP